MQEYIGSLLLLFSAPKVDDFFLQQEIALFQFFVSSKSWESSLLKIEIIVQREVRDYISPREEKEEENETKLNFLTLSILR